MGWKTRLGAVAMLVGTTFAMGSVPSASAHPGGTDSAGCHAGTKPYHCHGGPGAGSGSSSSAEDSDLPQGPSASERAAIADAENDLEEAKDSHDASKAKVAGLESRLGEVNTQLDRSRDAVAQQQAQIDDDRLRAEGLRLERIEQRDAAAQRVTLLERQNDANFAAFESARLTSLVFAGFFGGFFLLFVLRRLVGALVGPPMAWVLGGLVSSSLLMYFGFGATSFIVASPLAILGGLLMSATLTLGGLLWLSVRVPVFLTASLLVIAGLMVAGSVAVVVSEAAPVAAEAAAADEALVQEAESDPEATGVSEAEALEASADAAETKLEDLATKMAEIEGSVDAMSQRMEEAKTELQSSKAAVDEAEFDLEVLE